MTERVARLSPSLAEAQKTAESLLSEKYGVLLK